MFKLWIPFLLTAFNYYFYYFHDELLYVSQCMNYLNFIYHFNFKYLKIFCINPVHYLIAGIETNITNHILLLYSDEIIIILIFSFLLKFNNTL